MDPVGSGRKRNVDSVVDEQRGAEAVAEPAEPEREVEKLAGCQILLAKLKRYLRRARIFGRRAQRGFTSCVQSTRPCELAIGYQVETK